MQKTETFDFSVALQKMQLGYRVSREGWGWGNGEYYLQIVHPKSEEITYPILMLVNRVSGCMPWSFSHYDVLADDWQIYQEPVQYEEP